MMHLFEKKVRSMTPKEIIMSMVEGLRNPVTEINMYSFGRFNSNGVCYGCAATNTICRIGGYTAQDLVNCKELSIMEPFVDRAQLTHSSWGFIGIFEFKIDRLRNGDLEGYNIYLDTQPILNPNQLELPILNDDYLEQDLKVYEQLANDQEGC
jgi:hypothetical protein